jgi:hypothetical protein
MAFMAKSILIDREKNGGVDITREKFSSPSFSLLFSIYLVIIDEREKKPNAEQLQLKCKHTFYYLHKRIHTRYITRTRQNCFAVSR